MHFSSDLIGLTPQIIITNHRDIRGYTPVFVRVHCPCPAFSIYPWKIDVRSGLPYSSPGSLAHSPPSVYAGYKARPRVYSCSNYSMATCESKIEWRHRRYGSIVILDQCSASSVSSAFIHVHVDGDLSIWWCWRKVKAQYVPKG